MARLHGKTGNVHVGLLAIDTGEAIWTTGGAGRTVNLETSPNYVRVGSGSAKVATVSIGANALLYYKDLAAPIDLTTYEAVLLWVRSGVNQSAGDCKLLLDDTAGCGSAVEAIDLPALVASTWKFCKLPLANPASDGAIASVGIRQVTDLADMSFWVDNIYAAKAISGIRAWSMDYEVEVVETTAFDSSGVRSFIPTVAHWKGSFDGFKAGAPLTIGSVVGLELQESATATQQWRGSAIITKVSPKVDISGLVTYAYDFQGTYDLEKATA